MEHNLNQIPPGGTNERIPLFPGIDLSYIDIASDSFSHRHEAMGHIMQINHCRSGQGVWDMGSGSIFLNPGDYSVHTLDVCTDSTFRFPTGQYQGLAISIDLREASAHPPELLAETGIFHGALQDKFHMGSAAVFLAGNQQTESIFADFYNQPEGLRLAYQKIKVLELLLYLAQMEPVPPNRLTEYPAEQIEIVRVIHDQFIRHMERRITIEDLSKQYHVNPTTLKSVFKSVYGASLAAHIKKHRMERAAELLRETDMSVAEIAAAVGYESQGKFASAFKNQFATLPTAYRKQYQK